MKPLFLIRSFIFLLAALILLIFPNKVYQFHCFVLRKIHVTKGLEKGIKGNRLAALIFFIVAIVLFIYSMF